MSIPTLADLITQETRAAIYARALSLAVTAGLPVTSWDEGNPTRSLYDVLSTTLEKLEQVVARYVAAGFLDLAAALDDTTWIKLLAEQQYGYTAREATYATCTVRLTNGGGGVYTIAANDLVFSQVGDENVTYHNTTGGNLLVGPGTTLDVSVECDIAGSEGSAAPSGLQLVTGLNGVTATNTTAAVGLDEEAVASIVAGCRAKLEALSPNGAAGAYEYVALNADLTGAADVTRCRVSSDSATGDVTVRLASSGGAASGADVTLVETAILAYATPLCITPTVASASALAVPVTTTVYVYDTVSATTAEIKAAVVAAVQALFASIPIGGDGTSGKVYRARIISAIMQTFPGYVFHVDLAAPAADVTLLASQVATTPIVVGDVTVTLQAAP